MNNAGGAIFMSSCGAPQMTSRGGKPHGGSSRFPDVPTRPDAQANETFTRAPWSRVLPDRWFAGAFLENQLLGSSTGQPIPDPLPVGPDPKLSIPENPATAPVDDRIRWMIDFAAAEKIGMALRMTTFLRNLRGCG